MELVRRRLPNLDSAWTARSRCAPVIEEELQRIEHQLQNKTSAATLKMKEALPGKEDLVKEIAWDAKEAKKEWQQFMDERPVMLRSEEVWSLKKEVKRLVCCPMHKMASEGLLV